MHSASCRAAEGHAEGCGGACVASALPYWPYGARTHLHSRPQLPQPLTAAQLQLTQRLTVSSLTRRLADGPVTRCLFPISTWSRTAILMICVIGL